MKYRVARGRVAYTALGALGLLTAAAPFVVAGVRDAPLLGLAWIGLLAYCWYLALFGAAYGIDVVGDSVTFRSFAKKRETRLGRIRSIRSTQPGWAAVRFEEGRVWVIGPMDGWYEFISRVKAANPGVDLKGV